MYTAREAGRAVVTISPLAANWTVRFLSNRVFGGIEDFRAFAESGDLAAFVDEFYRRG